jgi:hypothetical protein
VNGRSKGEWINLKMMFTSVWVKGAQKEILAWGSGGEKRVYTLALAKVYSCFSRARDLS